MTLEQFQEEFAKLLQRAAVANLDPDDVCVIAEHMLAEQWGIPVED